MSEHANTDLKVVAVVDVNGREALVLNRPLKLLYERHGNDFVGSDGPFRNVLYYQRSSGRFVAFAGRELALQMKDGSVEKIKDHWWSGSMKGYESTTYSDVESLKKCYVFYGGTCIDPAEFAALRATYTGCVYPYWDYEKVIKYDDMRKDLYRRLFHQERRTKALTLAIKSKHRELIAAREVQS